MVVFCLLAVSNDAPYVIDPKILSHKILHQIMDKEDKLATIFAKKQKEINLTMKHFVQY